MKSTSFGLTAFACAFGFAIALKADPPPQPHLGTPPVFYYSTDQTIEPKPDEEFATLAINQGDIVVGWNYDSEDEEYISSDPTVTFKSVIDAQTPTVFYVYHGSTVELFNSTLISDFEAFDSSTITLGFGKCCQTVFLHDRATLNLGTNSKVVQVKLFDGTHVVADKSPFLEGSLVTNDTATAEVTLCRDEPSLQASGTSSITASDTDLSGVTTLDSATIDVSVGDVSRRQSPQATVLFR